MVVRKVPRDLKEPGRKATLSAELCGARDGAQKDLLRELLGGGLLADLTPDEAINRASIALEEDPESLGVPFFEERKEAFIGEQFQLSRTNSAPTFAKNSEHRPIKSLRPRLSLRESALECAIPDQSVSAVDPKSAR